MWNLGIPVWAREFYPECLNWNFEANSSDIAPEKNHTTKLIPDWVYFEPVYDGASKCSVRCKRCHPVNYFKYLTGHK